MKGASGAGLWTLSEGEVSDRDWSAVFVDRPTLRASVAQGLFYGGSGRRAVAHTRPAFAKNAYGPVGIPLIRGTSGAGQWTQPPSKGQIRAADNTAGRSATR